MHIKLLTVFLFLGLFLSVIANGYPQVHEQTDAQDHNEPTILALQATRPYATLTMHNTLLSLNKLFWRDIIGEKGEEHAPGRFLVLTQTPLSEENPFFMAPRIVAVFAGAGPTFQLADLDKDGTDELIIFYHHGGYGYTAKIYRIRVIPSTVSGADLLHLVPIKIPDRFSSQDNPLEIIDRKTHSEITVRYPILLLEPGIEGEEVEYYKLEGDQMIKDYSETLKHRVPQEKVSNE